VVAANLLKIRGHWLTYGKILQKMGHLGTLPGRAPPDVVNFEPGNSGQVGRTQQMQASEGPRVLLRGRDKLVVIQEGQGYRENFQIAGAPHLKFR
jgi:hypothetical protein